MCLSRSASAVLESTFGFFEFEHNLNEVSLDAPRAFACVQLTSQRARSGDGAFQLLSLICKRRTYHPKPQLSLFFWLDVCRGIGEERNFVIPHLEHILVVILHQ